MWIDFVGSFSDDATPSNMSTSSRRTYAARYDSGIGNAASSSPEPPASTTPSISSTPKRYSPVTRRENVLVCVVRRSDAERRQERVPNDASACAHRTVDHWAAVAAVFEQQHGVVSLQ